MSVFISYRRDGGKATAEKIYNTLSNQYDIFLDKESLNSGVFDQAIESQIQSCIDFVLIVTPKTFDRCDEQNDWILNEGRIALQYGKNIIPVFVGIDRFPDNVPDSLGELCRYNGIVWVSEDASIQKVQSFLKSNRRYTLLIDIQGTNPVLSKESRVELQYLLQRFNRYGRLAVDIDLQIADIDKMANNLIRPDLLNSLGIDSAVHYAKQSVLKRLQWYKKSFICAIEYMLQDELLDIVAMKMRQHYIDVYGVKNCYYTDDQGVEYFYWSAFLWVDVIEEMLKEITLESGRDYYYGNTRDQYRQVDLFVMNRREEEIWSFSSYITINPEDMKYRGLAELFQTYSWGDYLDIPENDLAFRIYPDLYFAIGSMMADSDQSQYEELCKYKGIFNLANYYIGAH